MSFSPRTSGCCRSPPSAQPRQLGGMPEDAVSVRSLNDGDDLIVAVADGLGGRPAGEIASQFAIEEFEQLAISYNSPVRAVFERSVIRIRAMEEYQPDLRGMGTTLTIVRIAGPKMRIWHVGDCVTYHLRGSGILKRTRPQTEAQELIDCGILTKASARRYHRRNASDVGADWRGELFRTAVGIRLGRRRQDPGGHRRRGVSPSRERNSRPFSRPQQPRNLSIE